MIRLPAAAGHDVLVRDPDRMENARGIMPEIVHTEVGQAGTLQRMVQTLGNGVRRALIDHVTKSPADRPDRL